MTPASLAAPAHPRRPGRRRAWIFRLVFLAAALGIGAWGALRHPRYQEWRLARLSLAQLQKERGNRLDDPRLLYYVGLRLNQQGRFREADPLLRQAVGLDPHSPRLRDEWARALLGSGLTTAAFGQLRQFAGTHPQIPEAHFLLGRFYFTQRSMRRASEEFEEAIRLRPGYGEAWSYLAGARDALNDMPGAKRAAERAVALRPHSASDHLMLASLYARLNQPEEARREFARAAASSRTRVELKPRQAAVHREYAIWLAEAGTQPDDLARAESEARKALALDADDARANLTLGRILLRTDRAEAAAEPLIRAASLAKNDPAPALELTRLYRRLGRAQEATRWERDYLQRQRFTTERKQIWEALRAHPDDRDLHRRMARLLGLHGDVAGCVHHHSMALRCAVDAPPALIAAANDLADGGFAAEALPLARRAVNISAANPAAHEALGNALLGLGQAHLAGQEYNKTAEWWPNRVPILRKKLERYYAERAKNPPPAERAYQEARRREREQIGPRKATQEVADLARRAVELEPTNPTYLWFLLRVQMARRENEAALQTAERLLRLSPRDARARVMFGVLLAEKAARPDELAAAEEHLKQAEGDASVAATMHYGLGLVALRRQQGEVAAKELRQAVQRDPSTPVTYYKLALAEKMAGNTTAAERAMSAFRRMQEARRAQAEALGDIAQKPDDPKGYTRAATLFDSHGLHAEAKAIREEARRRFTK
jgi:tetratricopeptide (TPR) repeat protein